MAKPDFSGTWEFNPAKSALQITAPESTVFTIDHRDPLLRLERTHVAGQTRDTFELELTTDGRETSVSKEGLQLRSRAHWDGETLVFETMLTRAGEEGTNLVRYTLDDSGDSFVAEEQFRSQKLSYDNRWVMDRMRGVRR